MFIYIFNKLKLKHKYLQVVRLTCYFNCIKAHKKDNYTVIYGVVLFTSSFVSITALQLL